MARACVDGVLLLDKPSGMTSNGALQAVKRLFNAAKAGHTGTLDPLASGVLPLCFGEATKFAGELLSADKRYRATVHFGISTSTGDAEGDIVSERPVRLTRETLMNALWRFKGEIEQLPPRYSALKHQGRNYYEYARAGIDIPRRPRRVEIYELDLEEWSPPRGTLNVRCSKGTYIRTLAEDLGNALDCGAHVAALRRIGIGRFDESTLYSIDRLAVMSPEERRNTLLPVDALVQHLAVLHLGDDATRRIGLGQTVSVAGQAAGPCRLYDAEGVFLGLGFVDDGHVRPIRLLVTRSGRAAAA